MQVSITYQSKSATLEAGESLYASNLELLSDTLSKTLLGVGIQLEGSISEIPNESK